MLVKFRLMLVAGAMALPHPHSTRAAAGEDATLAGRLSDLSPGTTWKAQLRLNLDGDGARDTVVLGTREKEVVVAVVLGATGKADLVALPWGTQSQDSICQPPSQVTIAIERCGSGAEFRCRPRSSLAKRVAHPLEAVRLDAGDCDAFHFYFDGRAVRWWRR